MKHLINWLERLSLDAVLVAVAWYIALAEAHQWVNVLILGLATWLAYVADRLWETRPGREFPETARHLYHKNNYKVFILSWGTILLVSVITAVFLLPSWKLLMGCALVIVVVLYLFMAGMVSAPSRKLIFKRIVMPIIFTSGVCLMSESWRSTEGLSGTIVLLVCAYANVLLISYQENRDKNGIPWIWPWLCASLVGVVIASNMGLFLYWPSGVAGLCCGIVYFMLAINARTGAVLCMRAWADGVLVCSALILSVLNQVSW